MKIALVVAHNLKTAGLRSNFRIASSLQTTSGVALPHRVMLSLGNKSVGLLTNNSVVQM